MLKIALTSIHPPIPSHQVLHKVVLQEGETTQGIAGEHQEEHDSDGDEDNQPFGVFEELDQDGGDEEGGNDHSEKGPYGDDNHVALALAGHIRIELPGLLVVMGDAEKEGKQNHQGEDGTH